jgi:hypothetical protein
MEPSIARWRASALAASSARPVPNTTIPSACNIGSQRLAAVKESADFMLVDLDHLDAIACQSLYLLPPGLRCGPPQCVVLVDVT